MPQTIALTANSQPFLGYLESWYNTMQPLPLRDLVADAPDRVACISVDVINGFCKHGPLASERVDRISQPVADLFGRAHQLGVQNFVLTQDTHSPETPEFQAYPPHCVRGSSESDTVPEIKELPFFEQITVIPKNSLSSQIATGLGDWMAQHPQLERFVVVGDCTDLCVYHTAMYLRLEANARDVQRRVVVPAHAVDTFDTPVETAREQGIPAHAADLHHVMFLHHMAMNGVEVVGALPAA
jgi:nicotinamidase-related amidase